MTFQTQNPATDEVLFTHSYVTDFELAEALRRARESQAHWSSLSLKQRAEFFVIFADKLQKESAALANQMHLEMGKPLAQARAEIQKSVSALKWASATFPEHLKNTDHFEWSPLGLVLAIMPWNFPVWQTVRALVSGAPVGNSFLVKPSEITPQTTTELCRVFQVDDFSLATPIMCTHSQVSRLLIEVNAVTLTGSSLAGSIVASQAGKLLKKSVLELGGADAYLVLEDADVGLAARFCADSRTVNAGQSCVSAKRFFVHSQVYDAFLEQFWAELQKRELGPLAHRRFQKHLWEQVQTLSSQAKLTGRYPDLLQKGAFYPAQMLEFEGEPGLWTEELFGPVACVWKVQSADEAIRWANNCVYALGAAVFSQSRAREVASQLQAGMVGINRMIASAPELPFGGMKDSGFGKELGFDGFVEFASRKVLMT